MHKLHTLSAATLLLASHAFADDAGAAQQDMQQMVAPGARTLSLQQALDTGRQHAPAIRVATSQVEVADAQRLRSESSLLPTVTGTATYLRTQANLLPNPGFNAARATTVVNTDHDNQFYNSFQLGLTAVVPLYDFHRSIDGFRSAKEARAAAEERARNAELTADFNVRTAFFQARATRALVGVAKETVANNQRHLEQVQAFVDVGTRPEIDLAQTRTDLANARVQLVQAENDYAIAKVTLQRNMGLEGPVDFEVADEHIAALEDEGSELDLLLRRALQDRPDVRALSRDLHANELSIGSAKGGYGPSINGNTGIAARGVEVNDIRYNVSAGVSLNWPLFSASTIADVRTARANRAITEANIADIRLAVRLQIEQARLGLVAAIAANEAAGEALENARVRHRLAEGRYEAGVGNVIELGDAQVALTQAEAQSVQADYNISSARAQLINALGRSR